MFDFNHCYINNDAMAKQRETFIVEPTFGITLNDSPGNETTRSKRTIHKNPLLRILCTYNIFFFFSFFYPSSSCVLLFLLALFFVCVTNCLRGSRSFGSVNNWTLDIKHCNAHYRNTSEAISIMVKGTKFCETGGKICIL